MYKEFMKSKITNRWGTSFKNVINEENSQQKDSSITISQNTQKTKQQSPFSSEKAKNIKSIHSLTH